MKRTYVLFLCFFSLFIFMGGATNINSPSIKVIFLYRMISRTDSTSKTTREELTQLAISDSLSEFRSFVRYKGDSLLIKYANVPVHSSASDEGMDEVEKLPKYNFKGIVTKNLKEHTCFYYGMIDKILYYYKDNDYPMNWQISPDISIINGYKCQKAFTSFGGRKYTAWFTRQIPTSNGPYKFGGLPGLIVSISDATNSYKFELIRVYQPNESYHIIFPGDVIYNKQSGKIVSKREYYRSYYDYQENFFGKAVASGMTKFDNEDGLINSYREKLKHRNNPIELDYKK